jgi:hypothetical protein
MASDDSSDILIRIEHRIEALERRVDSSVGFFDRRFDIVDQRFGTVDRRFSTTNERCMAIEGRLSARLNEPRRDFESLYAPLLETIQKRLDRLERHGTAGGAQRDAPLLAVTRRRPRSTRRSR